jgi:hypothetical protein
MSETTKDGITPSVATIHELQHAAKQFRIITTDEEIIQRTGEQIVRACQLQMGVAAWSQNFNLMCQHVAEWCADRGERLIAALVSLRTDKLVFYIVPASDHYDFDLGRAQADLDIYLNTRGGVGYVETKQVPAWEMQRFVPQNAYRVWPKDQ